MCQLRRVESLLYQHGYVILVVSSSFLVTMATHFYVSTVKDKDSLMLVAKRGR